MKIERDELEKMLELAKDIASISPAVYEKELVKECEDPILAKACAYARAFGGAQALAKIIQIYIEVRLESEDRKVAA